jgi:molybdopterin synthase catalytic subunit
VSYFAAFTTLVEYARITGPVCATVAAADTYKRLSPLRPAMKVLAVAGPSDAGKTTLVEGLVERLAERGRVGTVEHLDCEQPLDTEGKDTARHRAAGAAETYGVHDGGWFATGEDRTLRDVLDDLAVECEYAVVEGYGDADLPTIALGDATVDEPVLAAPTADDVPIDEAVGAIEAVEPYESLASLVARVKDAPDADRAGAIATFTGRVRERDDPDDDPTKHLEFERYDGVAEQRMATIRQELTERDGVYEVLLHHRTGVVEAGEDIVFVVVLAGHRPEAFRAVEDGIARLKAEVPLFKKEVTVGEAYWAHEQ